MEIIQTIAFGPACELPSWQWVGIDTARELSKYFNVIIYNSFLTVPQCQLLFIIKQHPPATFVEAALAKQIKVIYLPIDYYLNASQLHQDAQQLQKYHLVISHCERLMPLLSPYCQRVEYIDHHNRYGLKDNTNYKAQGYVLWIGGCQYLPYLLKWLRAHPIDASIKILTDIDNDRARYAATILADKLKLDLKRIEPADNIDGYPIYRWSELLQQEMMSECKAAIDIKADDNFNQLHKPATKAQQFIASGIPFAINSESYSYQYFKSRGFEICLPTEITCWFSREYWQQTGHFAGQLRRYIDIKAVGLQFKQFIESI